ncbi:MAG: Ribosomal protein S6--L-glutamate ligase [Phycisphaerae bacterium]|nr:Ribosomal protein S6--L-glutamate ligase [Phycisphaerae bacterium]
MRIGVIGIKDGWSSHQLADALAKKTGFHCLINMDEVVLDLESGHAYYRDLDLATLDALAIKKIGAPYSSDLLDRLAILQFVQRAGVRMYSDPGRIERLLNRLNCTLSMRQANIPLPPTTITENIAQAEQVVRRYGRAVLKPLYTTKARGMTMLTVEDNIRPALEQFRDAGNTVLYIQKMMNLPGRDMGLAFLGGEYLGCYARVRSKGSWNTTTHSGGTYEAFDPQPAIIELALRAQEPFGLDFTCVDIAETDQGPVVFEVSAFGGFRGLHEACGLNAAELFADYVIAQAS